MTLRSPAEAYGITTSSLSPLRLVRKGVFTCVITGRIVRCIEMSKNQELKKGVVAEIKERFEKAQSVVLVDYRGLTVAEVTEGDFTVSLIPHTRQVTNLSHKRAGSLINIENDIIGKYVEKLLAPREVQATAASRITMDFLKNNGF